MMINTDHNDDHELDDDHEEEYDDDHEQVDDHDLPLDCVCNDRRQGDLQHTARFAPGRKHHQVGDGNNKEGQATISRSAG